MGMADSDRGGSGSGGAGVGGGGGSTGGRDRGTGFDGRDTPGAPDASDGRRGSSMGPDGGRATGGGNDSSNKPNDWSKDTPGAPNTVGRRGGTPAGGRDGRGTNTPGSPAARARDAMSRHARNRERIQTTEQEGLVSADLGIGKDYSHPDAIKERRKTGAVSPREFDISKGYHIGRKSELAKQSVGSLTGKVASAATNTPGVGDMTKAAVGAIAGDTESTPETGYGAAVARNRASNTMAQSATQMGATIAAGPVAGMAVGMANTAINANRTKDIGEMAEAMGFNDGNTPAPTGSGNGNGTTEGMLAEARATLQQPAASPDFAWSPVDVNQYRQGLLSLAQIS